MRRKIEDYLIEFGEDISKEGYSIVNAGVKTFFKAKGELAKYTIESYKDSRFEIRLEDFAYEQEKIDDKTKENFYKNINAKQLNYLFELLEKARTTTYDIHAKILSKIYGNFIRKGTLSYFESNLLSSLDTLNDYDIEYIAYQFLLIDDKKRFFDESLYTERDLRDIESIIEVNREKYKKEKLKNGKLDYITFFIFEYSQYYTFQKCLQIGIFEESEEIPTDNKMYGAIMDMKFKGSLEHRKIKLTSFTKEFIDILTEVFSTNY